MKPILVAFLLTLVCVQAHNNLFFPGDAQFPSWVNAELIKKLKNNDELKFEYTSHALGVTACGYAGIRYAVVENLPQATRDNLIQILSELMVVDALENVAQQADENSSVQKGRIKAGDPTPFDVEAQKPILAQKSFSVFIHNKDFDFNKYPTLLRFNENFESEQINKAGASHFVDDLAYVLGLNEYEDKHAKLIRPLDIKKSPKDLNAMMGVEEPVILDGSKIVFAITLNHLTWDYATRKAGVKSIFEQTESKNAQAVPAQKLELLVIGEKVQRITYE